MRSEMIPGFSVLLEWHQTASVCAARPGELKCPAVRQWSERAYDTGLPKLKMLR
ncbi:hypothetical protein WN55_06489 [Dufourea novaeangliae]|uniref:Uncharacterized protein n=1 Tax=Dufourea novaeangliae TaxID=178035 RepID=A0A154PQ69_DUFNO|nr:hypothetical protein WN55_06489 [Dufourea novaeangliae]